MQERDALPVQARLDRQHADAHLALRVGEACASSPWYSTDGADFDQSLDLGSAGRTFVKVRLVEREQGASPPRGARHERRGSRPVSTAEQFFPLTDWISIEVFFATDDEGEPVVK